MPVTLFTFGYWGWGSAADKLVQACDAVERSRGYEPPIFVDIRLSRSVRAPAFNGGAFEKIVGPSRNRWMPELGNSAIREGGSMRIKNPAAAEQLLDLALASEQERKRVIFFCACEFPGVESTGCHRTVVARLVLEAAARRQVPVEVIEWPGGEVSADSGFDFDLSGPAYSKIRNGATQVRIEDSEDFTELAAMPWYAPVGVVNADKQDQGVLRLLSGPARYKKAGWYLPVYEYVPLDLPEEEIPALAAKLRERDGFAVRRASP